MWVTKIARNQCTRGFSLKGQLSRNFASQPDKDHKHDSKDHSDQHDKHINHDHSDKQEVNDGHHGDHGAKANFEITVQEPSSIRNAITSAATYLGIHDKKVIETHQGQ